jgi:hypothetical protein
MDSGKLCNQRLARRCGDSNQLVLLCTGQTPPQNIRKPPPDNASTLTEEPFCHTPPEPLGNRLRKPCFLNICEKSGLAEGFVQ